MENSNILKTNKFIISLFIILFALCILLLVYQNLHPLNVFNPVIKIETVDNTNPIIKKLTFETTVVNNSNKNINFVLEFTRENNDWYPYINLIPEKYITDELSIKANGDEKFNFQIIVNSDDSRLINSFYTYSSVTYYIK